MAGVLIRFPIERCRRSVRHVVTNADCPYGMLPITSRHALPGNDGAWWVTLLCGHELLTTQAGKRIPKFVKCPHGCIPARGRSENTP